MTAGERLRNWADATATAWSDRLRGWMAGWVSWGLELLLDILGKAFAPKLKPFIESLEKSGEVPPELQPLLDEMKEPTGQVASILSQAGGSTIVGSALGQILDALFRPLGYWANRTRQNRMPDLGQIMAFWLRGDISDENLPFFITS
ncbi:unnamed protein product, partial [marine sediment metagenome]